MTKTETIAQKWDPDATIAPGADPEKEFGIWKSHSSHLDYWKDDQLTLEDFRAYIQSLWAQQGKLETQKL